ncbi:hypothetical protein FHETE_1727 [Fusarium heterosporum]|uniref:Uncharacterized protein n=1 Tax=Fusarium heterosporum TaxID=42747 RepID=A0A8H5TRT6_FUSHE|nr:hypothetical protein FHETE_1727 [Fusarium heterosporum]
MPSHNHLGQAWSLLVLLGLLVLVSPVSASWADPFEGFYGYNDGLQAIIRSNCSDVYASYLENRRNSSGIEPALRIFGFESMTAEMMECILGNAPELVKSKMAAAAIVLGLAPTIIATLGVRPHDTALLSIIGRRHLLAFAIAVGSPAVNAYRTSEFSAAINTLGEKTIPRSRTMRRLDPIFTVLSYTLAAASIANVGELTYRLGASAIFTVLIDAEYLAFLWAFLGVFIHFMTGIAMRMRLSSRVVPSDQVTRGSWPVVPELYTRFIPRPYCLLSCRSSQPSSLLATSSSALWYCHQ